RQELATEVAKQAPPKEQTKAPPKAIEPVRETVGSFWKAARNGVGAMRAAVADARARHAEASRVAKAAREEAAVPKPEAASQAKEPEQEAEPAAEHEEHAKAKKKKKAKAKQDSVEA